MVRMNHIAYADVKLSGPQSSPNLSVLFSNTQEIDNLISALETLKNEKDDFGHCHLQDYRCGSDEAREGSAVPTEVYFYSPYTSQEEKDTRLELIQMYESERLQS